MLFALNGIMIPIILLFRTKNNCHERIYKEDTEITRERKNASSRIQG